MLAAEAVIDNGVMLGMAVASEIGESASSWLVMVLFAAAVFVAGLALFVKFGMTGELERRFERPGCKRQVGSGLG